MVSRQPSRLIVINLSNPIPVLRGTWGNLTLPLLHPHVPRKSGNRGSAWSLLDPLRLCCRLLHCLQGAVDTFAQKRYCYWLTITPSLVNPADPANGDVVAPGSLVVQFAISTLYLPAGHGLILGRRTLILDHLRAATHLPAGCLAFPETLAQLSG